MILQPPSALTLLLGLAILRSPAAPSWTGVLCAYMAHLHPVLLGLSCTGKLLSSFMIISLLASAHCSSSLPSPTYCPFVFPKCLNQFVFSTSHSTHTPQAHTFCSRGFFYTFFKNMYLCIFSSQNYFVIQPYALRVSEPAVCGWSLAGASPPEPHQLWMRASSTCLAGAPQC